MSAGTATATSFYRGENPLYADKLNLALSERVARSGDNMDGFLTLVGDPVSELHAVTKRYVDGIVTGVQGGSFLPTAGGSIWPGTLNVGLAPTTNVMTHTATATQAQINYGKPIIGVHGATFVGTVVANGLTVTAGLQGNINQGDTAYWNNGQASDVIVGGSGSNWTLAGSHAASSNVGASLTGSINGTTLSVVGGVTGPMGINQILQWGTNSDSIIRNIPDNGTGAFTGSITGNALTITGSIHGTIHPGDIIQWGSFTSSGTSYPNGGTDVVASGTLSSWTMSNTQTAAVPAIPMSSYYNTWQLVNDHGTVAPQAMTTSPRINTNNRPDVPSLIVSAGTITGLVPVGASSNLVYGTMFLGAIEDDLSIPGHYLRFLNITSVNSGPNLAGHRYGIEIDLSLDTGPAGPILFNPNDHNGSIVQSFYMTTAGRTPQGGTAGRGNFRGSVWGGVIASGLSPLATFYQQVTPLELDIWAAAGSSAGRLSALQIVHQQGHAVQGSIEDTALGLGDQGGVTAGWRVGFGVGGPNAQWPIDPNGIIFRSVFCQAVPWSSIGTPGAAAAGGFDVLGVDFTGTADIGGGFAFRADGAQVIPALGNPGGAFQAGAGEFAGTSDGAKIDITYRQMTGTPAVVAGGSGWGVGDTLVDQYGNLIQVATVTVDAIATVTVIRRGWQKTPPGNPVTFTQWTAAALSNQNHTGIGATFNLTWTLNNTLRLQPSGGPLTIDGILTVNNGFALGGPVGSGHGGTIYTTGSAMPVVISDQLWTTTPTGMTPNTGTSLWIQGGGNNRTVMDSFTNSAMLVLRRTGGTPAAPAALGSSLPIGNIQFHTYDGTAWTSAAQIITNTISAHSTIDHSTYMSFQIVPTGTTTVTEVARVVNPGLLIGNPTPANDGINSIQASGGIKGNFLGAVTSTNITLTGSTQAGAFQLLRGINLVNTVPASSGFLLPAIGTTVVQGTWVEVFNQSTVVARGYGNGTQTIDGAAAATGVPLSGSARCRYIANSASTWVSTLLGGLSA